MLRALKSGNLDIGFQLVPVSISNDRNAWPYAIQLFFWAHYVEVSEDRLSANPGPSSLYQMYTHPSTHQRPVYQVTNFVLFDVAL